MHKPKSNIVSDKSIDPHESILHYFTSVTC